MKSLLFIVSAIAVFAGAASDCVFDPIPACQLRDFTSNYIQYTGNPCDSSTFYQCERRNTGIVAHLQPCPVCLDWSDDSWGCTVSNGKTCPTEAPITEILDYDGDYCFLTGNGPSGVYIQQFRPEASLLFYYWRVFDTDVLMPCPPGTYFNFGICKCDTCKWGGPCVGAGSPLVFTLDFDNKASEKGIYFDIAPSARLSIDGQSGNALVFDGESSKIEVPFFQNNEFSQFKFDGYFRRDSAGGNGEQGILFDGASPQGGCWPPAIYVISTNSTSLKAGINTGNNFYEIVRDNVVLPDQWNRVVLSYNGESLVLSVNDDAGVSIAASGETVRTKCNLIFGDSYDVYGYQHFFQGKLDTLSFYREV